jgi:hypothetical protein
MPCLNAQLGISYSDKSSLASLDVEKDKYKLFYDYKSQVGGCCCACLCLHALHTQRRLICYAGMLLCSANRTWHSSSPTRAMWGPSRSGSTSLG